MPLDLTALRERSADPCIYHDRDCPAVDSPYWRKVWEMVMGIRSSQPWRGDDHEDLATWVANESAGCRPPTADDRRHRRGIYADRAAVDAAVGELVADIERRIARHAGRSGPTG